MLEAAILAACALIAACTALDIRDWRQRPSQSDLEYWLEDDEAEELRKSVRKALKKSR